MVFCYWNICKTPSSVRLESLNGHYWLLRIPTYTHEYQKIYTCKSKTNKFFPENSLGFSEKVDLNKIRLRVVGGSSNRTSFSGMILKKDDFTSFDDATRKLVEIYNIYT